MPVDSEGICFLRASAMKVEPNYEAEPITWREYLQRASKYAEMGVNIREGMPMASRVC